MVTALTILLAVVGIVLILAILLQSGRSAGLSGAISGGAESVFGKKKGLDDFLSRLTIISAIVFLTVALLLGYLQHAGG